MTSSGPYRVSIKEDGRSGSITCRQGHHSLEFHWEFGGGDVVVIIQVLHDDLWASQQSWFADRRAGLLDAVAREVIRQRAPTCHADIDVVTGTILLRQSAAVAGRETAASTQKGPLPGSPATPQAEAAAFVRRYANIRSMFALGLCAVLLIAAGFILFGRSVLMVAPASGVPLGEVVRTDTHIASLIQTTDPHFPEVSGRGGNETTSISVLLIPLDGSAPVLVPVISRIAGGGYALARILGSDGHTLWFSVTGLFGVRLKDHSLVEPAHLREQNPSIDPAWWDDTRGMDIVDGRLHIINDDRSAALDVDPSTWSASAATPKPSNARFERHDPDALYAAGFVDASGTWLGLHAAEELEESFKPGAWLRPVERATEAKRQRRLCRAELEAASDGGLFRIRSITPMSDTEYFNAVFLGMDDASSPAGVAAPGGSLMLYSSAPGLDGTVVIARVDEDGTVRWHVDTGIDRFDLKQILPGSHAFAFVGLRPQVPDKLSEPLVVLVENATGTITTHSLWR